MEHLVTPAEILSFWRKAGPERWFTPDGAFDEECRLSFRASYDAAVAGTLAAWEDSPEGALALVILLDQMPRNMFRGIPRAWETDASALRHAERALARGFDRVVDPDLTQFFYLPFMHAEDVSAQDRSVELYERLANENNLNFARHHRGIVARFGRFPHRNAVLGRTSTPEEIAFLEEDGFRG